MVVIGAELVQVPAWKDYEWLRHGFSRRGGGVSSVYGAMDGAGTLNLGWTKHDPDVAVAENRRLLMKSAGAGSGFDLLTMRQVHGAKVIPVRSGDGATEGRLTTSEGRAVLEADGLMTDLPGVMLGVQTADCVPVLVVDVRRRAVAAFHAGWRGTVARIAEHGVAAMMAEYGSRTDDLSAAVGPSIGSCCYAVGEEVRAEFQAAFRYGPELFRKTAERTHEVASRLHLDLWESNRRQLVEAGVGAKAITLVGECTACSVDSAGRRRYFSYRAEYGMTGRMMSVVGVSNGVSSSDSS